jgi:hypothetical protein
MFTIGAGSTTICRQKLVSVKESPAEAAAYWQRNSKVSAEDLVQFTAAARTGGSRWDDIAVGCGATASAGTDGVVSQTDAEVLFQATQYAVEELAGSRRHPPLTWPCPEPSLSDWCGTWDV